MQDAQPPTINRCAAHSKQKELQPARIDIGLDGNMPFDNALCVKDDLKIIKSSIGSKRMSQLVGKDE